MKKLSIFSIFLAVVLLYSACSAKKVEHLGTDLDLSKYESITLDILSIDDTSFVGKLPWAYPCTYIVHYPLEEEFCVGDRVEVYYTGLLSPDEGKKSEWTANVTAAFVDYSDFELDPNKCYKPVIYLYPTEKMKISVALNYNGTLTLTYPYYGDGWTVTAYPDGTLVDNTGTKYPYIFWEGESDVVYDMSRGFCVRGEDTEDFLREKLTYLGLNENESKEFLAFWLKYMKSNPYNLISFQTTVYTENAQLIVTPEPDSMLRVFMTFTPLYKEVEIEKQELMPFKRTGFTVVEWGGSIVKK